jgi:hypothetical protein
MKLYLRDKNTKKIIGVIRGRTKSPKNVEYIVITKDTITRAAPKLIEIKDNFSDVYEVVTFE